LCTGGRRERQNVIHQVTNVNDRIKNIKLFDKDEAIDHGKKLNPRTCMKEGDSV